MKLCPTTLGLLAIITRQSTAIPTWPSSIDELEDVMFLNTGYKSRGFSAHVTPCSFSEFGAGRQTAAEWLRIGFHDMSTTNVFFAPHGGIDASMAFELNSGENIGAGFNTSLTTYAGFYNTRLPVSDMIALGVYASVRACGGPVVPMRGGRVDATAAGPLGVPQPQNGQGTFTNQFARMGFNATDMIKMTACGHTLGGVHAGDFSNIVAVGTAPDDFQLFDTTAEFDNLIATRYINGPDTDPLSGALAASSGRNSDFAVFTKDSNVTLKAMTDAATFNSMCSDILQRMIEVVDPALVTLSDIIAPYEVKPSGLQLTLLAGGSQITVSGDIRVRTTVTIASSVSAVNVVYKGRTGAAGGTLTTTVSGTAAGFDDSFSFYGFKANIPASTSISSFTVTVTTTGGLTTTYDNNGSGFPVQDSIIVQTPQSCMSNGNLTVLAAVRTSVTTVPSLTVDYKTARASGVPVPALNNATIAMTKGATIGPYVLYSASYSVAAVGTKYGVISGTFADTFKDPASLGATCSTLGSTAPSGTSSSSSVSSTTTSIPSTSSGTSTSKSSSTSSTSSSASASATLAHKLTVGPYTFQGCYIEGTNVRALIGASYYDYDAMTIEECAKDCAGYTYWGVEYGGECYCGNTLDATSTLATLSDCNFVCPGSSSEYCGAGNRLEMYKLSATSSSSSSPISSTSKTSSSSPSSSTSKTSSASSSSASTSKAISSSSNYSTSKATSSSSSSTNLKSSSSSTTTSTSSTSSTSSTTSKTSSSSSVSSTSSSNPSSLSSTTTKPSSTSSLTLSTKTTSSSASASPTLHTVKSYGLYNYNGCWTEGDGVRALSSAMYANDSQTVASCLDACSPYKYAGAEYGRECWCADAIASSSTLAPDSDCSMTCSGDQYEYCGAGNRLTMYIRNGTTTGTKFRA